MTHFDKIAALTHQTFNTLIATIPENLAGRKVIAGMVMKRGEDDVGIVISIGTGEQILSSIFLFSLLFDRERQYLQRYSDACIELQCCQHQHNSVLCNLAQ